MLSRQKAVAPCPWPAPCLLPGAAHLCVLTGTEHLCLVVPLAGLVTARLLGAGEEGGDTGALQGATPDFQEEMGQEVWGFMIDFQPILSQPLTLGWAIHPP